MNIGRLLAETSWIATWLYCSYDESSRRLSELYSTRKCSIITIQQMILYSTQSVTYLNLYTQTCPLFAVKISNKAGSTNISAAKESTHISALARQFPSAWASTRSKGKTRRLQYFMIPHAIVEYRWRFSAAKCEGNARNCDTDPPRRCNKNEQVARILVLYNLQAVWRLKSKGQHGFKFNYHFASKIYLFGLLAT